MQIDPQQQVTMVVTTADGGELDLDPGRSVVARVVSGADANGVAKISLAGQVLPVSSEQQLVPGDTIRLMVQSTSPTELRLTLMPTPGSPPPPQQGNLPGVSTPATLAPTTSQPAAALPIPPAAIIPTTPPGMTDVVTDLLMLEAENTRQAATRAAVSEPRAGQAPGDGAGSQSRSGQQPDAPIATAAAGSGRTASDLLPTAIRELARAGMSVTPDMMRSTVRAIEALSSGVPGSVDANARIAANLIARSLPISEAVAQRVAAALDTAGRVGTQLQELARVAPQIATALPSGSPSGSALRGLLGGSVAPMELAIARIAQAQVAAQSVVAATPGTASMTSTTTSSNPQVVANIVASQLATARTLDELARASMGSTGSTGNVPGGAPQAPQPAGSAPPQGPTTLLTPSSGQLATQQAAVQGTAAQPAAAQPSVLPSLSGTEPPGSTDRMQAPPPMSPQATQASGAGSSISAAANADATRQATAQRPVTAEAAVTPGAGNGGPTSIPVAQAIAQLGITVTRLAPAMVNTAVAGDPALAATQAQIIKTGEAAAAGFTPESAGGGGTGAPAPLVASLRAALATNGPDDALASQIGQYNAQQLASALQQLPVQDALRIAGRLLELLPSTHGLPTEMAQHLRATVADLLAGIGRSLVDAHGDELGLLREALQQVASNDPRAHVARAAQQVLDTADGQLILSQPRHGTDPGYVWFTTPLPNNQQAEVLVRREPGRRSVNFDTFNIAFLLTTQSLGTLMINMEAHPAAVRTLVRTDRPEMEDLIAEQGARLKEPLERAAQRPLVFNTGVLLEDETPPTLFEPELGLIPGENAFYV